MNTINQPKFCVKYWIKDSNPRNPQLPQLKHSVFYTEEDLMKNLKNIKRNYFVYEIGKEFESKSYFDNLFQQEKIEVERQNYLKLKQKYENEEGTNS